jgi:hypothetical protein
LLKLRTGQIPIEQRLDLILHLPLINTVDIILQKPFRDRSHKLANRLLHFLLELVDLPFLEVELRLDFFLPDRFHDLAQRFRVLLLGQKLLLFLVELVVDEFLDEDFAALDGGLRFEGLGVVDRGALLHQLFEVGDAVVEERFEDYLLLVLRDQVVVYDPLELLILTMLANPVFFIQNQPASLLFLFFLGPIDLLLGPFQRVARFYCPNRVPPLRAAHRGQQFIHAFVEVLGVHHLVRGQDFGRAVVAPRPVLRPPLLFRPGKQRVQARGRAIGHFAAKLL